MRWVSARAREVTHDCVLMSTGGWSVRTQYFFESRREGVAGHRPRALLVWGVPHQVFFELPKARNGRGFIEQFIITPRASSLH